MHCGTLSLSGGGVWIDTDRRELYTQRAANVPPLTVVRSMAGSKTRRLLFAIKCCRPRVTICACLQLVVVVLLALVPLPGPQVARPPCHRDRSSVVRNIVSKVLNPQNHTKENNAQAQVKICLSLTNLTKNIGCLLFALYGVNINIYEVWNYTQLCFNIVIPSDALLKFAASP